MFRIKICGITSVEDAELAVRAGADAIGLNFYEESSRFVSLPRAREIARSVPQQVCKAGLWINAPASSIREAFDELRLDVVQLHGDEPPEAIGQLAPRPVARAFRVAAEGLESHLAYIERCRSLGSMPSLVLFDAAVTGQYGGTGRQTDWNAARRYTETAGVPPLVLAGGLTPENVARAIREVRPAAVDVASGVESAPGKKDERLVETFVDAARKAFDKM